MIDVRMSQNDCVDLLWIERELSAIEPLKTARPLEQAAVDQHARLAQCKFHARSGNGSRRTMECQRQFPAHAHIVRALAGFANPF